MEGEATVGRKSLRPRGPWQRPFEVSSALLHDVCLPRRSEMALYSISFYRKCSRSMLYSDVLIGHHTVAGRGLIVVHSWA